MQSVFICTITPRILMIPRPLPNYPLLHDPAGTRLDRTRPTDGGLRRRRWRRSGRRRPSRRSAPSVRHAPDKRLDQRATDLVLEEVAVRERDLEVLGQVVRGPRRDRVHDDQRAAFGEGVARTRASPRGTVLADFEDDSREATPTPLEDSLPPVPDADTPTQYRNEPARPPSCVAIVREV